MSIKNKQQMNRTEAGFTIVEVVVAALVVLVICVMMARMVATRGTVEESSQLQKQAYTGLTAAIEFLTNNKSGLQNAPAFAVVDSSTIGSLQPCTDATCDFYVLPASLVASEEKSIAGGVKWRANYQAPDGSEAFFVRRWLIEDQYSTALRLKKLTVAILSDQETTAALALEEKIVAY